MNQDWLIQDVLKNFNTPPESPDNGRAYLSLDEAFEIVDQTIHQLGEHGCETEYTYINGHRKRLAHSLSMIPKAKGKGESCLDVGSFGYMPLWAKLHLGYDRVVGIEWHPDNEDPVITRTLTLGDESIVLESHNFDISTDDWKLDEVFDTVLFFEVLEHINHDPMGVMSQIQSHLHTNGSLIMSVPNAISYKVLKEFLVGMPPWTYWFYEPDLSHEPRHCFEYTPIIFKTLIRACGMNENAFRTIYAYTEEKNETETIQLASRLGIESKDFGETMIINASKVAEEVRLRYPDVLYSPDGYYKNIYPHLYARLREVFSRMHGITFGEPETNQEVDNTLTSAPESHSQLHEQQSQINELLFTCNSQLDIQENLQTSLASMESSRDQLRKELQQTRDWAEDLQNDKSALEAKVNELLFTCDCYMRREAEINAEHEQLLNDVKNEVLKREETIVEVKSMTTAAQSDADASRNWAEKVVQENQDLRSQINELLFACDCYLQQVNDPDRCVQVIRERRFRNALRVSKSVARKTPVLRTALRPVYRSTKKFIKGRM
jgi:2-polyprenyl-3-methyl-5-hydroxy-6-metoxy-1,4-benzoquinol methylase